MSDLSDPGPDALEEWRSFGGAAMIDVAAGVVLPEALLIGPGRVIGCWQ
jgi:hypothetical protein